MITPQDTEQYGQVLRVSVVREILSSRASARASFRSKNPRPSAPPTAAVPLRNVRRSMCMAASGKLTAAERSPSCNTLSRLTKRLTHSGARHVQRAAADTRPVGTLRGRTLAGDLPARARRPPRRPRAKRARHAPAQAGEKAVADPVGERIAQADQEEDHQHQRADAPVEAELEGVVEEQAEPAAAEKADQRGN